MTRIHTPPPVTTPIRPSARPSAAQARSSPSRKIQPLILDRPTSVPSFTLPIGIALHHPCPPPPSLRAGTRGGQRRQRQRHAAGARRAARRRSLTRTLSSSCTSFWIFSSYRESWADRDSGAAGTQRPDGSVPRAGCGIGELQLSRECRSGRALMTASEQGTSKLTAE